jgi:uncharacterized repeat protein (TIGR03803 family)
MAQQGRKRKLGQAVAVTVLSLTLVPSCWAGPKYNVLHAFGAGKDGAGLWSSVVFDKTGNLYSTTSGGGAYGYGTVFQLRPGSNGKWSESLLRSFRNNDPNGDDPNGGLIFDTTGHLYGTTLVGGPDHDGVVFEMTPGSHGWKEKVLHAGGSWASVVLDPIGNLYGTTEKFVFELQSDSGNWTEKVIHRFCSWSNCRDGVDSFAGLILDAAGNLYGTTRAGGTGCGGNGCGTVFELIPTSGGGWKEAVLHAFDNNGIDGDPPGWGTLAMDRAGTLYGTTAGGGCCGGVVFKLTPQTDGHWKETILYDFKGGASGFGPGAGVVMDKAGNLYGTTVYGGSSSCGCGVVYKLAPTAKGKWTYTVLHTFTGNDGAQPDANLILDSQGNLYGTTATGGANGGGVVFELTP